MTKKQTLLFATAALMATMIITVLLANGGNSAIANAINQTNEYGCAGNCTGEYEIRHVKQILQDHPELNGSANVRFKVKVSKVANGLQWYQDLDDTTEFARIKDVTDEAITNQLATSTAGIAQGLTNYQQGDLVAFAGTVYWTKVYGNYTLDIQNLSVYRVNDKEDLKYLPPVNYLM